MNDNDRSLPATVPATIPDQMRLAQALARSELVPRAYRGKPANILLAINLGRSLGLEPAVALTAVQVIEGQASLSAQAQAALVRRAGHKLRITGDDEKGEAVLIRSDDPDYEHKSVWTMERAKRAGLTGKGAWRQYPAAMLMARATTEVIRMAASDVLLGACYTPEELGRDNPENVLEIEADDESVA